MEDRKTYRGISSVILVANPVSLRVVRALDDGNPFEFYYGWSKKHVQ